MSIQLLHNHHDMYFRHSNMNCKNHNLLHILLGMYWIHFGMDCNFRLYKMSRIGHIVYLLVHNNHLDSLLWYKNNYYHLNHYSNDISEQI